MPDLKSLVHPTVLGIIPARGGSKGVPGKNIAEVAGRPLISWTIEAAKESGCLERVVVSTDCEKIAEIASRCGAEVPFLRPRELAGDASSSWDAVIHALHELRRKAAVSFQPSFVMLLQPTSPLRSAEDIKGCLEVAIRYDAESVISITESPHHLEWGMSIGRDGRLSPLFPGGTKMTRRQDSPPAFFPNGAIYLIKTSVLDEGRGWYNCCAHGYVMPQERSLDIDTPWDLSLARLILEKRQIHSDRRQGHA